jgi:hypothetical protein
MHQAPEKIFHVLISMLYHPKKFDQRGDKKTKNYGV